MKSILLFLSFSAVFSYAQKSPKGQESLLIRTVLREPGIIYSLSYSPDGRYIATAGVGNALELRSSEDGTRLRTFKGHNNFVNSLAFSPDGNYLATASEDSTIKIWNVEDASCVSTLKGHTDAVAAVAYFPDGKSLASGSTDGTVRLWRAGRRKPYKTLKAGAGYVYSVAVSSDGARVASGYSGHAIKVWDLEKGGRPMVLEGHADAVNAVAFSGTGIYLASGSEDGSVKIWRLSDGICVQTIRVGHPVFAVIYSPDGNYLFSGGKDNAVTAWDAASGRLVRTYAGHNGLVRSIALSPDGKYLASGSFDKTMKWWLTPWEAEKRDEAEKSVVVAIKAEVIKNEDYERHCAAGVELASSGLIFGQLKAISEFRKALSYKEDKDCREKLAAVVKTSERMALTILWYLLGLSVLLFVIKRVSRARERSRLRKTLPGRIKNETFSGSYDSALRAYTEYKELGGDMENLPREEMLNLYRGLMALDALAKENLPYQFLLSYAGILAKEGNYSAALSMFHSGKLLDEFKAPADHETFVEIYRKAGAPENMLMFKFKPSTYSALAEAFFKAGDHKNCGKVCALKEKFHADKISPRDKELAAACAKAAEANGVPSESAGVRWNCMNCGFTHIGRDVPEVCPTCKRTKEYFKVLS